MFDLTDRDSFDQLDHWLKELRENCDEHCEIAIMANKVDIVNQDPALRMIKKEEIEAFVEYNNIFTWAETSAKEDIMIKETFESLLKEIHKRQKHIAEQKKYEALRLGQRTIHNEENGWGTCRCA